MRADKLLCTAGLARSRTEAQEMIRVGAVFADGRPVRKPAEEIDDAVWPELRGWQREYVSRGGFKLAAALDAFFLDVSGAVALDVGASTGGFTDCLLRRGAAKVFALDAGHGQLVPELRRDARVRVIENFNARALTRADLGEPVSVITMDVSFISQTCILPALPPLCTPGATFVALIKPQFEAGTAYVGRGGIVRDARGHRAAIERTVLCAAGQGFSLLGVISSPITGGDGNREFLAAYTFSGAAVPEPDLQKLYDGVGL